MLLVPVKDGFSFLRAGGFSSNILRGLDTDVCWLVGVVGLILESSRVGTPPDVCKKSWMVLSEAADVVEEVAGAVACVGLATIFVKAPSSDPGLTRLIRMFTREGAVVVVGGGVVVVFAVTLPKSPLTGSTSAMRGLPTRPEKSLSPELMGSLKSLMNRG